MKPEELRIGNLVDCEGIISKIEDVGCNMVSASQPDKIIKTWYYLKSIDKIKPIPLTKDWLIPFGFEFKRRKSGTRGVYTNGKVNLTLSNSGNVYTSKNKLIPHVHTLQNWYYYDRLTGEELKLKEDEHI